MSKFYFFFISFLFVSCLVFADFQAYDFRYQEYVIIAAPSPPQHRGYMSQDRRHSVSQEWAEDLIDESYPVYHYNSGYQYYEYILSIDILNQTITTQCLHTGREHIYHYNY